MRTLAVSIISLTPMQLIVILSIYGTIVLSPILGWLFLNRHALRKKQIKLQSIGWLIAAFGLTCLFVGKASFFELADLMVTTLNHLNGM